MALLAGVSVDYYTRLEQGRERSPSAHVLDALGEALRLDGDGRLHLYRLAGLVPRGARSAAPERVGAPLLDLLGHWVDTPALVLGQAYDVLASNRLGDALFGGTASTNLVVDVFLDPASRSFYADWQSVAASAVAGLRLAEGVWRDAPRLREVLGQLLADSPEFAQLWERNDAAGKVMEVKHFVHPEVGPLTLRMQSFDIRSAPGQQLVVYHPEPGSSSAQGLSLLGSLAASRHRPATARDQAG